ncbi:MAG TPA: BadF/BadG/BcrA/BcrD ATPase family protein [Candidatus Limnocylindria bacterium]|nr:BadF/BadG/BcrA/BcrD ATPase family protein [Candidatus Limnocylindria bacterium]
MPANPARQATVLAVDGGNSKTDLALVSTDGRLLALVHGPTISHQQVPIDVAMERLARLEAEARAAASSDGRATIASLCLAGADFASDIRTLERAIAALDLADRVSVANDAFAGLRAGAPSGWGIVVVCGAGVNAAGMTPDGRRARLAALGEISGDWGGGYSLGMAALGAAVRARDGRGPATSLSDLVPARFGLTRPMDVTRGLYDGRIGSRQLEELAPLVFDAAVGGDAVARGIVDRLADELAVMGIAIARRLRMVRDEVDVVLAGGVFRTGDEAFFDRLNERLRKAMPRARMQRLRERPVLGAALLGLDALGVRRGGRQESALRSAVTATD